MQSQRMDKRKNPVSGGFLATQRPNSKNKISKYLTVEPTIDSPFKNTLSEIENRASNSDDSDFKTPNKIPKPFQMQKQKNATKKRLRQKKISSLIKSVEENFSHENVNTDHLQMALALSKSISEAVDDGNESEVYNAAYPATQTKIMGVRKTLEEFGFKSGRARLPGVYQRNDVSKKRKKSKFQYVTPILFIRTEEERQKIVANKISLVLTENSEKAADRVFKTDCTVSSEYLREFCAKESAVFGLNSLEMSQLSNDRFYVKNLNLTHSQIKCGGLLKNWRSIPGRELTPPPREITFINSQETNAHDNFEVKQKHNNEIANLENGVENFKLFSPNKRDEFANSETLNENLKRNEKQNVTLKCFSASNEKQNKASGESVKCFTELEKRQNENFEGFKILKKRQCHVLDLDDSNKSLESFVAFKDREVGFASKQRSVSPDLFESDDEASGRSKSFVNSKQGESANLSVAIDCEKRVANEKIASQESERQSHKLNKSELLIKKYLNEDFDNSLLSFKSRKVANEMTQQNGILHFESFCEEFVDLTQSSDDDGTDNEIKEAFIQSDEETNVSFHDAYSNGTGKLISTQTQGENEKIAGDSPNLNENPFTMKSFEETFRRESMNITDYIHNILNENRMSGEVKTLAKHASFASECSIYISDEEINYSSAQANAKQFCLDDEANCASQLQDRGEERLSGTSVICGDCEDLKNSAEIKDDCLDFLFTSGDLNESEKLDRTLSLVDSQESVCIDREDLNGQSNDKLKYKKGIRVYNKDAKVEESNKKSSEDAKLHENCFCTDQLKHTEDICVYNQDAQFEDSSKNSSEAEKLHENCFFSCSENNDKFKSAETIYVDIDDLENEQTHSKSTQPLKKPSAACFKENSSIDDGQDVNERNADLLFENEKSYSGERAATPKPELIVRTTNVTPQPDYEQMDSPKVALELKKYGIKTMKRKRGIQLLKYIYDATHPFVGDESVAKKRKITENVSSIEILGDAITENEPLESLIFETKQSARLHSCRVPLQIAFHNLLSCNPEVRQKILLYEPLHVEEIYLMLKNEGFKYNIKDLLTFLDRKCITVRTNHK